jgi:hypothetical protein
MVTGLSNIGPVGSLSDARIRAAKPKDKAYKLSDSPGLYLKVSTPGGAAALAWTGKAARSWAVRGRVAQPGAGEEG